MRTYVKIEGNDVEPIIQKLARLAVNLPEICVYDMNIEDMSWLYPYSNETRESMGYYFGLDVTDIGKHCDRIISKTGQDLGDANIYFEWATTPTNDQLERLKTMIDNILKPYGNKYVITNIK